MEKIFLTPQEEVNSLVELGLKALNDFQNYDQDTIDYIVAKVSV